MADGRQNRKTAISPQWFKRLTWAAAVSRGIPRICRGDPRNLANNAAEFGKICRGKLWALSITIQLMGWASNHSITIQLMGWASNHSITIQLQVHPR